jgi:uncharacterized phage-associated protein
MSLLKLCYIAHGWRLEITGEPLFPNDIQAWQYGPVIPEVYRAFRGQGVQVTNEVPVPGNPITPEDDEFLEQIYNIYGNLSAFQLSDLTHVPGGPWDIASKVGGNYAQIPNDLIKQHYQTKRQRASG